MTRKYAGDFTFNESGAVRHQPNIFYNSHNAPLTDRLSINIIIFFRFIGKTGTDLNFSVEVKKLFNEVTAQYPKRKTVSFHLGMTDDDNDLISILIKNGANENESAVLTLTESYVYEFYFNGGQLKDYTELSEW